MLKDGVGDNKLDWFSYNHMQTMAEKSSLNNQKYLQFKEQIKEFEKILSLEDARELSQKIMPLTQEYNQMMIGNATFVIVNQDDSLRISLDSDKEFICYDFV